MRPSLRAWFLPSGIRQAFSNARRRRIARPELLEKRRMLSTAGVVAVQETAPVPALLSQYTGQVITPGVNGSLKVIEWDAEDVPTTVYSDTIAYGTSEYFDGSYDVSQADNTSVDAVAIDANGRVLIAGIPANNMADGIYAVGTAPGSLDLVAKGHASALAVAPNGDIVAVQETAPVPAVLSQYGGPVITPGVNGLLNVVELDDEGDPTSLYKDSIGYGSISYLGEKPFVVDNTSVDAVTVDANGRVVIAGIPANNMADGIYAVGTAPGSLDLLAKGHASALAVAPNGDIVAVQESAPVPNLLNAYSGQIITPGAAGSLNVVDLDADGDPSSLYSHSIAPGSETFFDGDIDMVQADNTSVDAVAVDASNRVLIAGIPSNNMADGVYALGDSATAVPDLVTGGHTVALAAPRSASAEITSVTDSLASGQGSKTFGTFLAGVPIPDTFSVNTSDPGGVIQSVEYQVGSGPELQAKESSDNVWTFDPNLGQLSANQALTITALDQDNNPVATYPAKLVVQDDLHVLLDITPPGGSATPVPGLRFLEGVALPSTFTATITDLPSYYQKEIQIGIDGVVPDNVKQVGSGSFLMDTFSDDPGLQTGDATFQPFFESKAGTADAPGVDSKVTIHAVPVPDWLVNPANSYSVANQQYQLAPPAPLGLNESYTISGIPDPIGLIFNQDIIKATAGLNLSVTAGLSSSGKVTVTPGALAASLNYLGKTVFNQTLETPSNVHLTATLDPDTLDAADDILITTDEFNLLTLLPKGFLLFNVPFGTGNVPIPLPSPLSVGGTIEVGGDFQAAATTLNVKAGFDLDVSGDEPELVATDDGNDASYLQLNAAGSVTLTAYAQGSLGLSIVKFPLISALVAGGISAVASTTLNVDFSGPLDDIDAELNTATSTAGITVGYAFDWDYGILNKASVQNLKLLPQTLGPYPLFGLSPPPTPGFDFLPALIIAGLGNKNTLNQPVVGDDDAAPTDDAGTESVNQAIRPAATGLVSTEDASAASPIGTLTVDSPIYAPLTDIKFGLDVLADEPTLAAGHELLDTVLVGLDGGTIPLSEVDLSTIPLSAGGSTLGYASGYRTIEIPVDSTALALGAPYEIEFELTTDAASTGHPVAVAFSNLILDQPQPKLTVTSPDGGSLDFGQSTTRTIALTNTGQTSMVVSALGLVGSGFALVNPPGSGEFALAAGETISLQLMVLDASKAASAAFQFRSTDPTLSAYSVALTYAGVPVTPVTVTTPEPSLDSLFLSLPPVQLGRYFFVTSLYQDVLGRTPDLPGLEYWLGLLNSGTSTTTVRNGFFRSAERAELESLGLAPAVSQAAALADANRRGIRDAEVDTLYLDLLGRPIDEVGLAYWTDELAAGKSLAGVASGIAGSAEAHAYKRAHRGKVVSLKAATAQALKNGAKVTATALPKGPTRKKG